MTRIVLILCCALLPWMLFAEEPTTTTAAQPAPPVFTLTSLAVVDGGNLPVEFTGDGASATLPLAWSHVPAGTKSFTLVMHHIAPDMTKWYWILYNIPANVECLPKNVHGIGTPGSNSVNHQAAYAPPHSKGPGAKTYILTLYALDATLTWKEPPAEVTRDIVLDAMKGHVLGSATLSVVYTRGTDNPAATAGQPEGKRLPEPPGDAKPGDARPTHDFDRTPLSQALDADGNGSLNAAEITGAMKCLQTLDANHDGKLGAEELDGKQPANAKEGPKRPVGGPLMRILDADRNSELSAAEIANAVKVLRAADTDHNGTLTITEVDAAGGDPPKQ